MIIHDRPECAGVGFLGWLSSKDDHEPIMPDRTSIRGLIERVG
jgi:hypothetical protein